MEIDPRRILVACQGPTREPFFQEVEYLFKSLSLYGGKLAESKKIACFTESLNQDQIKRLEKLSVKSRIVQDIDKRCIHASKIQNLSLYKEEDFEFLISLDTDVVVTNDFSSFIDESKVGAKPVDQDPLSLGNWSQLFGYFGLEVPQERYLTSFQMSETIPYFNSGVLLIPKKYVEKLYEKWKWFVFKLLDSYKDLPEIKKHSFFTDQLALSLALTKAKIPHKELPLEMNFPTHSEVHNYTKPNQLKPYLIHYHHKFTSHGKISHCSYPNINKEIDKINESVIL